MKVCNDNHYKYNYLTKKETIGVIVYSLFKSLSIAALISPFDSIRAAREKRKFSRGYKNTCHKCTYIIEWTDPVSWQLSLEIPYSLVFEVVFDSAALVPDF